MRMVVTPWHGVAPRPPPCHKQTHQPHVPLHVLCSSSSSDHHHHHQYTEKHVEEEEKSSNDDVNAAYVSSTAKKTKQNASLVRTAETRGSSFAIPLQRRRGPGRCAYCDSSKRIACRQCGGSGVIEDRNDSSSLYHSARMNPVVVNRILHSKWTAMERTCGWRHFHVTQTMNLFVTPEKDAQKKNKKKKTVYVLLVATCDDQVKLWCPISMLKCRELWAAGWLQKSELQSLIQSRQHAVTKSCDVCDGGGTVPCMFCSGDAIIDLSTSASFPW
ncbi:hypothetical protein PSENEW3n2_00001899 [Picochlorum sp. SENEW3]|nr:hypothetical protein PSENEW3n2_00001899 [Picochlorum sp. SENEW3]WPT14669.1 hypothetical protein PSENEW3_00001899 [Picochlorum sp. SENEW3]